MAAQGGRERDVREREAWKRGRGARRVLWGERERNFGVKRGDCRLGLEKGEEKDFIIFFLGFARIMVILIIIIMIITILKIIEIL